MQVGQLAQTEMRKIVLLLILLILGLFFLWPKKQVKPPSGDSFSQVSPPVVPTATPSPKPTPTPTIDWSVYGPCKWVPVLMYHHVNSFTGQEKTSSSLTVSTAMFTAQMDYLSQKGYQPVTLALVLDSLAGGAQLPPKPIVITFDDAYADNFYEAFPILRAKNFPFTIFIPSGLIQSGPDYLTWEQVREMKGSGLLTLGNHTWSHLSLTGKTKEKIKEEISLAQGQITIYGGEPPAFFAYPYGNSNGLVAEILGELGFKGAVITAYRPQCLKDPYHLGRIRIGSAPLSNYGL